MGDLATLVLALQDIEEETKIGCAGRIEGRPAGFVFGAPVEAPAARVVIGPIEDDASIVVGLLPFVGSQGSAGRMFCVRTA